MKKIKLKDSLSISYIALDDEGKNITRANVVNELDTELLDEDLFEFANLIKDTMKYNAEKVVRKYEISLEEE